MKDVIEAYLEKHGIPVTRENYVQLNTLGDESGREPLDGENEAELPDHLHRIQNQETNEEPEPETDETNETNWVQAFEDSIKNHEDNKGE